jgi:hypothetical protein
VPPGVVTDTLPEVPVLPGRAYIVVEFTTENEAAGVPPKLTTVAPVKFVPVIVIVVELPPQMGLNVLIVGAATHVNPARDVVPRGAVTDKLPEVPDPTTAVIWVAEFTVNEAAAIPPKLTPVAPVKFTPVIITVPPFPIFVGEKEVIVAIVG